MNGLSPPADTIAEMFRPPVNRAMQVLDRSFFRKKIPLSAAHVLDRKQITKMRSELYRDTLRLDRMQSVQTIRTAQGEEGKGILLNPEIESSGELHVLDGCRYNG